MILIKPEVQILQQESGVLGVNRIIELAGRTCYKSEENITDDSAKVFVKRMIDSGHGAMLEHGTVYLYIPPYSPYTFYKYRDNKYSAYVANRECESPSPEVHKYITTNLRVMVENGWLSDLKYQCKPTIHHEIRLSVKFICDRGVSHELVRHRVFSFAQESTRYCNYSKSKFGNQLTFIIPSWLNVEECIKEFGSLTALEYHKDIDKFQKSELVNESNFLQSLAWSESNYLTMVENGMKPQEARAVLPNALKTEVVMTGFLKDWKHFFDLRCSVNAHPDMKLLADELKHKFKENGYEI